MSIPQPPLHTVGDLAAAVAEHGIHHYNREVLAAVSLLRDGDAALLALVVDEDRPTVVRERAFGRVLQALPGSTALPNLHADIPRLVPQPA